MTEPTALSDALARVTSQSIREHIDPHVGRELTTSARLLLIALADAGASDIILLYTSIEIDAAIRATDMAAQIRQAMDAANVA